MTAGRPAGRPAPALALSSEQPYLEQLARGHRSLRFQEPLEQEYRRFHGRLTLPHLRVAYTGAIALCLLTVPLELWVFRTPPDVLRWYAVLMFGALLPALIVGLTITRVDRTGRVAPAYMVFALCLMMALLTALRVIYAGAGAGFPYYASNFVVMVVLLLSGLRFFNAVLLTLALAAALLATDLALAVPPRVIAAAAFNFLGTALIAGAGAYLLEYLMRGNFLHQAVNDYRSNHDPLTGLLNRRGFTHNFQKIWRQAYRERKPVGLMLADADRFGAYCESQGPVRGDEALRTLARTLKHAVVRRSFDFAARLDSDEFAVAWFNASPMACHGLAEDFRAAIEALDLEHRLAPAGHLTVTAGCAVATPGAPVGHEDILRAADAALRDARKLGGNRVLLAPEPAAAPEGTEPQHGWQAL